MDNKCCEVCLKEMTLMNNQDEVDKNEGIVYMEWYVCTNKYCCKDEDVDDLPF